jgi:pilus assembly protein CpaB
MKRKKIIVAVTLGMVAGFVNTAYILGLENELKGGEQVEILVAAKKTRTGEILGKGKIATRVVPAICTDERNILVSETNEAVGLTTSVDLEPGQMVQWTDFDERKKHEETDLAELVGSGQRALTIRVNGSLSMGGMLKPGHRVDILGTFAKGLFGKEDKTTFTLLQNVRVLATGSDLGHGSPARSGDNQFDTVTLAVSLEAAELLSLARTEGTISLVLRGRQDLSIVGEVPEKRLSDLWEAKKRNAIQNKTKKREKTPRIERIKIR